MKYQDLTIDQKIQLKEYFKTDFSFDKYLNVWILTNIVKAIDMFLSDHDSYPNLNFGKACTTCDKIGHTWKNCREISFYDTFIGLTGVRFSFSD